jgi:hypothetical protein
MKTTEETNHNFADRLSDLESLEKYIEKKINIKTKQQSPEPYESANTDQICTALAKAQGEFPKINANRRNNFMFNQYSDLDMIMRTIRKALADNGLSVTQQTKIIDDKVVLITTLRHESAQFIQTRSRIIPSRNDVQTYASLLKAMRRHDIMGLLNITIVDDMDDDDGERNMEHIRKERIKGTGLNMRYKADEESFETISQDQLTELERVIGDNVDIVEDIYRALNIESLVDIPKSRYAKVKSTAQLKVNIREGKTKLEVL